MDVFVRIGYIILYILLFIFCLSVLIIIHELGHLGAAKFFKVYCQEFSIGFGPAIIHKKRKNGETYFSLRAFPLGGYVSMVGEGETKVDGDVDIPPERSLANIRRWKRIVILFAGVFNNAILALVLFFVSEQCFVQTGLYLNYVGVEAGSVAETSGIQNDSYISLRQFTYQEEGKEKTTSYYVVDRDAYVTYTEGRKDVVALLNTQITSYNAISYDVNLKYFEKAVDGTVLLGKEITAQDNNVKGVFYNITIGQRDYFQYYHDEWISLPREEPANPEVGQAYIRTEGENKYIYKYDGTTWKKNTDSYPVTYLAPESPKAFDLWCNLEATTSKHPISLGVEVDSDMNRKFAKSGVSFYKEEYWNDFPTAFKNTFVDWGNSATAIVRGLISLFTTPETWKDVGGIIAIGVQTTNVLQNLGAAKFIYIWGLISVNLAIVNLFPFPGLDGWQILVEVVEGIFRRKIPSKVKSIISLVGVGLLLVFMVLIIVKDIIGLF